MISDDDIPESEKLDKPVCDACAFGNDAWEEWEQKALKKYGWIAHMVTDNDPECPYGVNIHTHAVPTYFLHPDFQVCLPLDPKIAHNVLADLVARVKAGESFEEGQVVYNIIANDYPITFIKRKECDRDVLRIIFPDDSGCLDKETMDERYRKQYEGK